MSDFNRPDSSCIRRAPTTDAHLAEAMRRLHALGPRLVCELELEIDALQGQIATLRESIDRSPPSDRGAELVGLLKGA